MGSKKWLLVCMLIPLYGLLVPLKTPGAEGKTGGHSDGKYTAHRAAELWLAVEQELEAGGQFRRSMDDFTAYVGGFLASPVNRIFPFSQETEVRELKDLTASFTAALEAGRREDALALVMEIRRALIRWQMVDGELADSINETYLHLFLIFTFLMAVATLAVWQLYRALGHARKREQHGQVFSREMMLALEQERSRIARELHDTVAQDLHYLALRVGKIERVSDARERNDICAEIAAALEGLIRRVRSICDTLVPPDFIFQGLPDALRRLCYDYGKRTGIDCRIDIEDTLRLDPMSEEMQLQCFRIVQEALTNIEKHANASEIVVVVRAMRNVQYREDGAGLCISVSDDGKGFDPPVYRPGAEGFAGGSASAQLGIRGMYERAAILRGRLAIESERGEGTIVKVEIPVGG
ncbi:multi-sensor signal transduction histidine kinase [Treponema primitia ZAS-2]|uniref:histidine kinase n=1 Tax=Treponema primitia (strain ATCC BAA-887 / DSM 12427 / ZAS-2) TaxID=545694 RepID=F5YIV0_TREPZ|nr:sensor histidine kinase [Treponema primitia]AEF85767.1 multi-sensor signal transduction histidine kinase [Treponema primitia ZAS-2]